MQPYYCRYLVLISCLLSILTVLGERPALAANGSVWSEVERLTQEQKMQAALDKTLEIHKKAREQGDIRLETHALVRSTQMQIALQGYETAVRRLKEQPWPQGKEANAERVLLNLYYGHSLISYYNNYSWEINQREKTVTNDKVDLKAWTREQIGREISRTFDAVIAENALLDTERPEFIHDFLRANNFPKNVRPTLRDAVVYLAIDHLRNQQFWDPKQINEVYSLDLEKLLSARGERIAASDERTHPLERAVSWLKSLEKFHLEKKRPEAALEAKYVWHDILHQSLSAEADRTRITQSLKNFQTEPGVRAKVAWWAHGQALLARFLRDENHAERLINARREVVAGIEAFKATPGGQDCQEILFEIERPAFRLTSMAVDGAQRRSLLVNYQNLKKLHFRAYAFDLSQNLKEVGHELQGGVNYERVRKLIDSKARPQASWSVELPETSDYSEHRYFPELPRLKEGFYYVVASIKDDFGRTQNRLQAVGFFVSKIVLAAKQLEDSQLEVRVINGESGAAVSGAEVSLYFHSWNQPPQLIETRPSDAAGAALFAKPMRLQKQHGSFFVVARLATKLGEDWAMLGDVGYFARPAVEVERKASLIYTDRSIYRPGQSLHFKVVAYQGKAALGRLATAQPGEKLEVQLLDLNRQMVAKTSVSTNKFGTASGTFLIPQGRPLGSWQLKTVGFPGYASVSVEEYKRPTFEVEFQEVKAPLRLNRRAHVTGTATYYFGAPVSAGNVRWRVLRTEVLPWWVLGWFWPPRANGEQTVATGLGALKADGTFAIEFDPTADEREAKTLSGVTYNFRVAVDVTDEGGETRSTQKTFRVGFNTVETRLEFAQHFFDIDRESMVDALLTNLDGQPLSGEGKFRVVSLKANGVVLPAEVPLPSAPVNQKALAHDLKRARWETDVPWEALTRSAGEGTTLAEGKVAHDTKGQGKIKLPKISSPGVYRLVYETTDAFGEKFSLSRDFVVAPSAQAAIPANQLPLPFVALADKTLVKVGDKFRLFLHSGFDNQELRVEIFRAARRISAQVWRSGREQSVLEFPVNAEDRGGLVVSVSGVRDFQRFFKEITVNVPWDDRELKLEFASFRDKLRPGAHEKFIVRVKGEREALKEGAEVLAYMYDRSLDLFRAHFFPDILSLYPNRVVTPFSHFSLGQNGAVDLWSSLPGGPGFPEFHGDHLAFFENAGIGGPGVRFGGLSHRAMMKDEVSMLSMAAPPPSAERVAAEREVGDATEKANAAAISPVQPAPVGPIRSQFSETAFFKPHLLTSGKGTVELEFAVPDSVTSWRVWAHALTRDFRGGSVSAETKSVKELMVRPYVPRFLREGDAAEIRIVINNTSSEKIEGELEVDIEDSDNGKSARGEFALKGDKRFSVAKGGSHTLTYSLVAPKKVGAYALKVVAKSKAYSDGERRPLPLLPSRLHLAQSRFVTLRNQAKKTLRFADLALDKDSTRVNEQMVVTVDAQLFYGVLRALPYLSRYPYECTEQTLNRFLSAGIVSSLFNKYPTIAKMAREFSARKSELERFDEQDPNRRLVLEETPWLFEAKGGATEEKDLINVLNADVAKTERDKTIRKLQKMQLPSGAFPWFEGGPADEYMTLYLLVGLSRALEFHVDVPKEMVVKAWTYLRSWMNQRLSEMMLLKCCHETVTMLSFALSSYPDDSWTGGNFDAPFRQKLLDYSFARWKSHAPLIKGYLALTLARMKRGKDAELVWSSVMDSAKSDEELGTYWAAEDRSWLWYNDTIETHAFSLRVQMELDKASSHNLGLVQWLFLNKKLNHWKSTRATAEVIYALAKYLDQEGGLGVRENVKVEIGGGPVTELQFDPEKYTGRKNQIVVSGEKVTPKTAEITVAKQTPGIAFASATWHFSSEELPKEERGDFFTIKRKFFKREHVGNEWVLKPLSDGAKLSVGDQLEVQISLNSKHEAEYVHLRDPRGAGFEPETLNSGYKWDLGLFWYEETRDSGTNFFFSRLPVGEYTFKYRLRANMAGTFRVGPAAVQSMYAPEFNAYSNGSLISVRP